MSDNITREPYRNAWYKQLSDAVKKHDEEIAEMTPHLVPEVEEGDNGKILIAGEYGAFDWGQPPEELPIITEGDEGKVLKVNDGVPKWTPDLNSIDVFKVLFTQNGNTITSDKTYAEITSAINDGKFVYGVLDRTNGIAPVLLMLGDYNPGAYDFITVSLNLDTYPVDNIYPYQIGTIGRVQLSVTNDVSFSNSIAYYGISFLYTDSSLNYELDRDFLNIYSPMISQQYPIGKNAFNILVIGGTNSLEYYTLAYVDNTKVMWCRINDDKLETYTLDGTTNTNKTVVKSVKTLSTLPTATSADEGKVLMVDSNGDYVLGTVVSGSPHYTEINNTTNISEVI